MPTYAYVARDRTGKRVSGSQEGASKEALANLLREKGLTVSKIEEKKAVLRAVSGKDVLLLSGLSGQGIKEAVFALLPAIALIRLFGFQVDLVSTMPNPM